MDPKDQDKNGKLADEQAKPPVVDSKSLDLEGLRQQLNTIQKERDQLAQKVDQINEEKLKNTNNFKQLWEQERQKREEAETKAKKVGDAYLMDRKLSEIEREANRQNIDPDYMHFLKNADHSSVGIETTSTGNINIYGAKEFVEGWKKNFPKLFVDAKPPIINNGGGNPPVGSGVALDLEEIMKLEKTNPKEYQAKILDYVAKKRQS